ncbi:CynX/NimT family MFS transporter [Aquabacterium sp. J223]|uniref:MFS transporter n=1 Tax=Aquabacterium sp. J223 TaxID=2898431 RepID=UPI0021AD88EF|nr:MFS transporter [Aquabacterium sp. J223]UUX96350.1 MFS transporter [Aquabacterium sp. J223]
MAELSRTRWGQVALLQLVGIACAMQVGKVPPAIGALRQSLGMSLVEVAWVLALLSAVAALGGSLAGSLAARWGAGRVVLGSLLLMAAANALGALSPSPAPLLASRTVEGAGFLFAVVAVPGLLAANSAAADRPLVFGLWGAYMGLGMAAAMFAAPALLAWGGWRGLWGADAALLALLALALGVARPQAPPRSAQGQPLSALVRGLAVVLRRREVQLLGLVFLCHAYQYMAVFGFLPTVLHEAGMRGETAAALTATAVLFNALGNTLTGWLFKRGARAGTLLMAAALTIGAMELALYAGGLSAPARVGCALVFSLVAGIPPATVFVRLQAAARQQSGAEPAIAMGFVVQCSHIGQMFSPVVVAALASALGGWQWSPAALLPMAAVVFWCGWRLQRGDRA